MIMKLNKEASIEDKQKNKDYIRFDVRIKNIREIKNNI